MTLFPALDLAGDSPSLRRRWIPDPLDQASGLSPCFGKLHWSVLWESLAETTRIPIRLKTQSPSPLALTIVTSLLLCSRMNKNCTYLLCPALLPNQCEECPCWEAGVMSFLLIKLIHKVLNYYWLSSSPMETLRPMELFTQILDRKEAPFWNLLELPSIKSWKLNRRFSTALQIKLLTNTWSLLHAQMSIQTYAASSAKSTAAALFFFYYFCLGS